MKSPKDLLKEYEKPLPKIKKTKGNLNEEKERLIQEIKDIQTKREISKLKQDKLLYSLGLKKFK